MIKKRFTLLEDTNGGLDTVLETMVKDNGKFLTHKECCDLLNELHEENQLLKQRLARQNDVEWLRNNTVWEVMPSNHRTYISTIYHRRNDE